MSAAPQSSTFDTLNPNLMCSCGHPRREHWFRCRGATGERVGYGGRTYPIRCDCTKFTNPANTILAQHPGPACPCFACFLAPTAPKDRDAESRGGT